MNSARFAKVAKVLALCVALGTGLTVAVVQTPTDHNLHAQEAQLDNTTSEKVNDAVAEFNRGNYEEAAKLFNEVMIAMPKSATEGAAYLNGVRSAVPNDTQHALSRI
ncbi:MAG: hypothetical protein KDB07_05085, partial [Planctomycetes bacterium]|nr:hypothetical protein [Planctomycetota bacterium]